MRRACLLSFLLALMTVAFAQLPPPPPSGAVGNGADQPLAVPPGGQGAGAGFSSSLKGLLNGVVKLGQQANILPEATAFGLPEVQNRFNLGNVDIDNSNGAARPLLPTPEEWINATTVAMGEFNLAANLNKVGMALLFAFFVWSLINLTYYYQSDQYLPLFSRLIIAAGLIFAAPVIGGKTLQLWEGVYDTMSESVVRPATDGLEEQLNTLGPQLTTAAVITVAIKIAGGLVPTVVPGNDLIDEASALSGGFTKGIFGVMVLMGSLYGIYLLTIYASALTIILAGVLLPVLAAFLMLPGSSSWFNRWLSMVVLAFANVVAFPFVYSVVITVGVNKPMQTTNEIVADMLAQLAGIRDTVTDSSLLYVPDLLTTVTAAQFNIQKLLVQWIFSLIFLAIAVLASIYIMQQLPGLLQGFLGGVSGRAAGAASSAALAGILGAGLGVAGGAGGLLGKVGKGGGSPDTPKTTSPNVSPRLAASNQPALAASTSSRSASGGGGAESPRRGQPALAAGGDQPLPKDNGGGRAGSTEVKSRPA